MKLKNSYSLVVLMNHMGQGGCQKYVYDLVSGLKGFFKHIYLISLSGHYSKLLPNNNEFTFLERENTIFVKRFLKKLNKKESKYIFVG